MMSDGQDSSRTHPSLLEGIKNPENRSRWEKFAGKYTKVIEGCGRRAALRDDEIKNLVQVVLIEVSAKIGEFSYDRSKGTFKGWLKKLAARRAIDQIRKRVRVEEYKIHRGPDESEGTGTIERQADLDQSDLERAIDEEWVRALHDNTLNAVREQVGPEQFELYDAYVLQDWPVDKVQKVFGVNANQVYLARTRVGKVVKEEGLRIAAEMDHPDMPPEQPSTLGG